MPIMNKQMLMDAFDYYHTDIFTGTKLKEVTDEGSAVILKDGTEKMLPCDTVIVSIGYRPRPSFAEELKDSGAQVFEIGDGRKVGNVMTCIADAFEITHTL